MNPLFYAYLRRLAEERNSAVALPNPSVMQDPGVMHELVRLQSAYLPGFNCAVSSSLRAGARHGHAGTADHTVPPAHAPRIKALIEGCATSGDNATSTSASTKTPQAKPRPTVSVSLIPGAGHALTWTHAEEVGREAPAPARVVPALRLQRPHFCIVLRASTSTTPRSRTWRVPHITTLQLDASHFAHIARRIKFAGLLAAAGPPEGACG
ncbi:hypothetical protein C8R44DRAFT_866090 [Mycena epipterygia]|nr:hypothetical protein C8R44DRAFT_866090 [Mycena epipterygia]